jgi:AraC-like DNA-binding protein
MTIRPPLKSGQPARTTGREPAFTEAGAWENIGEGWRPLHGSFRDLGYSVEWHDFDTADDLDWAGSFHPGGVEICLNLAGRAEVRAGGRQLEFSPLTAGFYLQSDTRLKGVRRGGERHQFITVEFSRDFVARHIVPKEPGLHPCLRTLFKDRQGAAVSEASRLTTEHQQLIRALQQPPVNPASRRMWSHAKALEVAASLFYAPAANEELFCDRVKRLNRERVQKVIAILKENLAQPPSLDEIGRRVGCSHFHLSRIFSEEMGRGIFQHLRELRLERAAVMLGEGDMKITQVAMEVGYASPSHFTTAFRETFGCCPGLYPLRTLPSQVSDQPTGS